MRNKILEWLALLQKLLIFGIAFVLVIIFLISIDDFTGIKKLYFLRTGNYTDLVVVIVLGWILSKVLEKLLILQWRWGVRR